MYQRSAIPKFFLGEVQVTRQALPHLSDSVLIDALLRHVSGDWGLATPEQSHDNIEALRQWARLVSVYQSSTGTLIRVETKSDRSATRVSLESEASPWVANCQRPMEATVSTKRMAHRARNHEPALRA